MKSIALTTTTFFALFLGVLAQDATLLSSTSVSGSAGGGTTTSYLSTRVGGSNGNGGTSTLVSSTSVGGGGENGGTKSTTVLSSTSIEAGEYDRTKSITVPSSTSVGGGGQNGGTSTMGPAISSTTVDNSPTGGPNQLLNIANSAFSIAAGGEGVAINVVAGVIAALV
ncbi:hypothetical protein Hypma_012194 [Hypsizygus marmoreus]|uniref:Uncharacterized protein n=1 Tax=Hypsizygus marmoreus TaxID=39966 RepID=A0A369JPJ5_HYPMA|nr:hypothetical protein Hypma_012194 [Hypsizygus marmoreus]